LQNLKENLRRYSYDFGRIPLVFQYNKQDLADSRAFSELEMELNEQEAPAYAASAIRGDGVIPTLRSVSELVLRSVATGMVTSQQR
jgi:hypothetical protein